MPHTCNVAGPKSVARRILRGCVQAVVPNAAAATFAAAQSDEELQWAGVFTMARKCDVASSAAGYTVSKDVCVTLLHMCKTGFCTCCINAPSHVPRVNVLLSTSPSVLATLQSSITLTSCRRAWSGCVPVCCSLQQASRWVEFACL